MSSTQNLFKVVCWPRLPRKCEPMDSVGLWGRKDPARIGPTDEQFNAAVDWMEELQEVLDYTLVTDGAAVGLPLFTPGVVPYADATGLLVDSHMWWSDVTHELHVGVDGHASHAIRVYGWGAGEYLYLRTSPGWSYCEAENTALALWGTDIYLLTTAGGDIDVALGGLFEIQDRDATWAPRFSVDSATGQALFSTGVVGTPSISFLAFPTMGFWASSANRVNLAAGGLQVSIGTISTQGVAGYPVGTGPGAELRATGGRASLLGYDRATPAYVPVEVVGSALYFKIGATDRWGITATALYPETQLDIGTTAKEIGNVYVGSDKHTYYGDAQQVSIWYDPAAGYLKIQ